MATKVAMPSKVASLAVVGASAYGASTLVSAFVAPGAPRAGADGVRQMQDSTGSQRHLLR